MTTAPERIHNWLGTQLSLARLNKAEQQNTREYRAKLATQCQGAALKLSYNNEPTEGAAKHLLLEASHALNAASVRVHKKRDGLLLVNARGKSRYMTWRERIAYWALGGATEIQP